MITLSDIFIYPVKSLGGIALQEAIVERRGLQYDRRWMLVNNDGRFVSQREIPEMALLRCDISDGFLKVYHSQKSGEWLKIPLNASEYPQPLLEVEVWGDKCPAIRCSALADHWFSDLLGDQLRLVYMPEHSIRPADAKYAPEGHHVSFADGFPFLVISQASLEALNSRLAAPLPMNRFRPNFVVEGAGVHEEDSWSDFRIGEVPFRGVKPCGRCTIITTDQETGQRGAEPLRTLAGYRNFGGKVCFGQNLLWMGEGAQARVRVGDTLHFGA